MRDDLERTPLLPSFIKVTFEQDSIHVDGYAHDLVATKKWRNQGPFWGLLTTVIGVTFLAAFLALMFIVSRTDSTTGDLGLSVGADSDSPKDADLNRYRADDARRAQLDGNTTSRNSDDELMRVNRDVTMNRHHGSELRSLPAMRTNQSIQEVFTTVKGIPVHPTSEAQDFSGHFAER